MNIALVTISPPGNPGHGLFTDVIDAFQHALSALGHHSIRFDNTLFSNARNVIFGAHLLAPNIALPQDAILVNLEQLENNPYLPRHYLDRLARHTVWDYSAQNVRVLESINARDVQHVPIGYAPGLTRISRTDHKDVDILFYGSLNPRRVAILDHLASSGVYVERLFQVYGAARDAWIARSKIVLNIKFYENNTFEAVRVSYLLSNGIFVASELAAHNEESQRYIGGVAFSSYDRLVQTCLDYLDDPAAREAVAARGLRLMQQYDQQQYLRPALEKLQRAR